MHLLALMLGSLPQSHKFVFFVLGPFEPASGFFACCILFLAIVLVNLCSLTSFRSYCRTSRTLACAFLSCGNNRASRCKFEREEDEELLKSGEEGLYDGNYQAVSSMILASASPE